MTPILITSVQIPYHLFVEFKSVVDTLPLEEMNQWNAWRQELYDDSKATWPLVQYRVGTMIVPDVYGYLYTLWIVAEAIKEQK